MKYVFRIDFEVISRNLNASPVVRVVRADHGLHARTHAPAFPSQVVCKLLAATGLPVTHVALTTQKGPWHFRKSPGIPNKPSFTRREGQETGIHHLPDLP